MRKIFLCVIPILFAGCGCNTPTEPNSNDRPPEISRGIAVITTDALFSASGFGIIDVVGGSVYENLIQGSLHTDLAVRTYGSDVYILERMGRDNIIKYDSKKMGVAYHENLGAGINIQDIAVVSQTKAYISCNSSKDLIVFNPHSGKKTSVIDLSAYNAGEASHPYASAVAVYGHYVYVACQRFITDNYGDQELGQVVIIDSRADTIVNVITLEKKNPHSMDIFHDRLLVASAGHWLEPSSGGVEMIDLTANINLGVVADMDGASRVAFISLNKAYVGAGIFDENWNYSAKIFPINPQARTTGAALNYIGDGFGGIVYDGFRVYIGEQDYENSGVGVVVVNPATDAFETKILVAAPMMPAGLGVILRE